VPDFLFHNRGNGTFEEVGLLAGVAVPAHGRPSPHGTDFRDVDNDGWPDIVLTALNGETFPFFKNDGGKFFHDATYPSGLGAGSVRMAGWGAAFVDLDNDGFKDLVTANSHANDRIEEFESSSYRQTNGLFRNNAGHFTDVAALAGPDFAVARANRGIGVGDFDGDGRLDLVVTVLGDGAQLLRNVSDAGRHWITLRLVGKTSSRDGILARVKIGSQVDQMTTAVGYASSSNYGVHFGLDAARTIDRSNRVAQWVKQMLENVAADQEPKWREADSELHGRTEVRPCVNRHVARAVAGRTSVRPSPHIVTPNSPLGSGRKPASVPGTPAADVPARDANSRG
jgi:hypothetical protein